jgi:multiple antibiotic resistance protein
MVNLAPQSVAGCGNFWHFFTSLLLAMNPAAVAALFVAMTLPYDRDHRESMIRTGSWIALSLLLIFALTGDFLFHELGITLPSFRIASGMLLLAVGFGILRSDDSDEIDPSPQAMAKLRPDWGITPLAVPLLASPNAITATISRAQATGSVGQRLELAALVILAVGITYGLLVAISRNAHFLGKTALKLFSRLSGLILVAMAMQFILVGLEQTDLLARYFSR